jgi:two-component system response regulator VicR
MRRHSSKPQKRILIIDDDQKVLEKVRNLLTSEGYGVCTLSTGDNILEVVNSFEPDLILLNVLLPEKPAEEICKELKKTFDLPIILLTAHPPEMLKLSCDADHIIEKPFENSDLLQVVESHLRENVK